MKLGTETGSLTNHILSRMVIGQPEPEVGMGATVLAWTDRYAGTIIQVWNVHGQTHIMVQEDQAIRLGWNGMTECQGYSYAPNQKGQVWTFRRSKGGRWDEVYVNEKTRRFNKSAGHGLRIGEREKYHDFSF